MYFIFTEGDKKEALYFYHFNRLSSQIKLQLVRIEDGKNHPMGLYENACRALLASPGNPSPKYDVVEEDEVWFVIDTDAWQEEIPELKAAVAKHKNWFVAQSNPSFEVWLYYHFEAQIPEEEIENWKDFLNDKIKGGFDNRKHPVYLERAATNAESNYSHTDNIPDPVTTEVFRLAQKILPLVKDRLDDLLNAQAV